MTSKKRILFVDDEQSVLDGLQDRLVSELKRWDMQFVSSGAAALKLMGERPVDVVVSDMRMPGMDGADLLAQVRLEHPGAARIVLTGHAEREAILRALPVAHQILSKPCDTNALRIAIERTCELQRMFQSDALRSLIGGLSHVPSVPRVYARLTQVAADPKSGIAELADVIASDPAMASKVLQLTNSAYFGLRQSVSSIHQAVGLLGVELIKGLALVGDLFASTADQQVEGCSLERLQEFALLTARVAKKLLPEKQRAEEAFTAGLVHDIGRLVLAQGMSAEYAAVVREARSSGQPLRTVEQDQLGVTHAEVGAYLLGMWGLPFAIVEAVAQHHTPGRVPGGDRQVLLAVHVADALVDSAFDQTPDRDSLLDHHFLRQMGCSDRIATWRKLAENELATVKRAA